MRIVTKESGYSRTVTNKGSQVWFEHATLHKASGNIYALRTGFDFANVPEDVIRRLAGETLLIRWRTAFKGAEHVDETADNKLVSVTKMLTGRKPRMSKGERIEKLSEEMSKAEKLALLKRLQASLETEGEADDEAEYQEQEQDEDFESEEGEESEES